MNKKLGGVLALLGATLWLSAPAYAASVSEGFEGSSYDYYADPGATAELSTNQAHGGSSVGSVVDPGQHRLCAA